MGKVHRLSLGSGSLRELIDLLPLLVLILCSEGLGSLYCR